MLNRSLYEDMLIAHWVKRHPDEAPAKFERHETWMLERWVRKLRRHGHNPTGYPTLTNAERRLLDDEFRGKTWTGFTLPEVLQDVRSEWEPDTQHLEQVNDIVNTFNNTLLHHGARALALAGGITEEGRLRFNVGPSSTHIWGALFGAFFSYANTTTLVLEGNDLNELHKLYNEHLPAFLSKPETDV